MNYKSKGSDWQREFRNRLVTRNVARRYQPERHKLCRPYSKFAHDMIVDTVEQFQLLSSTKGSRLTKEINKLVGARDRYPVTDGRKLALYLLGIRMHVFVDTWAHQDFVGEQNEINSVGKGNLLEYKDRSGKYRNVKWVGSLWTGLFGRTDYSKAPDYYPGLTNVCAGHSQIGSFPDYAWLVYRYRPDWRSSKSEPLVRNNPVEFSEAWNWMAFVMGLCNEQKSNRDMPDSTPQEIETVLNTYQDLSDTGLEAFSSSEACWAETGLAKKFVDPVYNRFTADNWPKLDKQKLGLFDDLAHTRFGTIKIRNESVLHYMELASAIHYQFYYRWLRENEDYNPEGVKSLWRPET